MNGAFVCRTKARVFGPGANLLHRREDQRQSIVERSMEVHSYQEVQVIERLRDQTGIAGRHRKFGQSAGGCIRIIASLERKQHSVNVGIHFNFGHELQPNVSLYDMAEFVGDGEAEFTLRVADQFGEVNEYVDLVSSLIGKTIDLTRGSIDNEFWEVRPDLRKRVCNDIENLEPHLPDPLELGNGPPGTRCRVDRERSGVGAKGGRKNN